MEKQYFGKKEVCQILDISVPTLDRMVKAGDFPKGVKVGKSLRWHKVEIERWINKNQSKQIGDIRWILGRAANVDPNSEE